MGVYCSFFNKDFSTIFIRDAAYDMYRDCIAPDRDTLSHVILAFKKIPFESLSLIE